MTPVFTEATVVGEDGKGEEMRLNDVTYSESKISETAQLGSL